MRRRFREIKEVREVKKNVVNDNCPHMEGPAPTITYDEACTFFDNLFSSEIPEEDPATTKA